MTNTHTTSEHRHAASPSPTTCVVCRTPQRPSASRPPSDKQLAFLGKLTASRLLTGVAITKVEEAREQWRQGTLTAGRVSELIDFLKELPWKDRSGEAPAEQAPKARWPQVDAGRYAISTGRLSGNHTNLTNFYKVDRPSEGTFAGRTFVKLLASDEEHPVRGEAAREVLEIIAEAPTEALKLYGQMIGSCGHCGRTLTDDESRAFGVGPKCRGKLGL